MFSRCILPTVSALLAIASASAGRDGINLCAAYHNIVPLIEGGEESCKCDGRTIVCNFPSVCKPDDGTRCADVEMNIDFSANGKETIIYDLSYDATTGIPPVSVILDVSANVEEGVEGCFATIGATPCQCGACDGGTGLGSGVSVKCPGVVVQECTSVDVKKFETLVPFFDKETDGAVVAQSQQENSSGSVAFAATKMAGATTLIAGAALMML